MKNLRKLRREKDISQEDLGKVLKLSPSTIGMYEQGRRSPDNETLKNMASFFNVSTDYLLGISEKRTVDSINAVREVLAALEHKAALYNVKKVPIVGTIACGRPILATENIEGYAFTNDPAADFVLVAKGDSMEGKRIRDGDLVFIHQQEDVEDGEIAAVLIDGDATLKIVHHGEGMVILSPANDKYSPMVFHAGDVESFRILGKAVKVQIDFK